MIGVVEIRLRVSSRARVEMSACAFERRWIAASNGVNVHTVHARWDTLKVVDHLYKSAVCDLILVEFDRPRDLIARDVRCRLLNNVLIDGDSARRCSLRRGCTTATATSLSTTAAPATCRRCGWLRLSGDQRSSCT